MIKQGCIFGIFFLLVSCNTYDTDGLIDEGDQIRNSYSNNFIQLTMITDSIITDSCFPYYISATGHLPNMLISFERRKYEIESDRVLTTDIFKMDEEIKKEIGKAIPIHLVRRMGFLKNSHIWFRLDHYRSKDFKYSDLVYVYDKEKFKMLFPHHIYYDKDNIHEHEDIKERWIYFYDDNWAITTSYLVPKMTQDECLQLLYENDYEAKND